MLGKYLDVIQKLYKLNKNTIRRMFLFKMIDDNAALPQLVHEQAQCCFVLSTGRCGTKLLTDLLDLSREIICEHQASPALAHFSKLAYEASHENGDKFELGIDMARYELIQNAFLRKQIYVETDNRIVFFAPFLTDLFKKAKFIHIVRHPADFVRSGIRRKWYKSHVADVSRIVPINDHDSWVKMTQIEKIAWLWNETNQFIEDFKCNLKGADRVMFAKSEHLFSMPKTTLEIFEFLHAVPPPKKKIDRIIKHPVNVQRKGDFPQYDQWNAEQKEQLRKYATLSSRYGYDL